MHSTFAVLIVGVLLCACSSSGDLVERTRSPWGSGGNPAADSESYLGPPTAAVAPVSDRRSARGSSGEQLDADIQRSIQSQLDRSGIFAGVVALDYPGEENEAEVIIEPALLATGGSGGDDVGLRVRVTEKTERRVVLDKRYDGRSRTNPLNVAITELQQDLGDRYAK